MARPATAAVRLLTGEREPVRLATTANIDVDTGGLLTIDGIVTAVGDRVLVKDQTDGSENGIRTVSAGQWYRAADSRSARTMQYGTTVIVQEGTVNANKIFKFNTLDPVIGDDAIVLVNVTPIKSEDADASGFAFVVDEDDMASDSATKVPTQQSVKAYADTKFPISQDATTNIALDETPTGGFYSSDTPPARIHRMADRIMLGDAVDYNGLALGAGGDGSWLWAEGNPGTGKTYGWIEAGANLGVASSKGLAVSGVARNANGLVSIGVNGIGFNEVADGFAWGGYFEAVRKTSDAGNVNGIEVDATALVASGLAAPFNPYTPYPTGGAAKGIWLASGGDLNTNPVSFAADLAMGIVYNGNTWDRGIVIFDNALTRDGGTTGRAHAIGLAYDHAIEWYEPATKTLALSIVSQIPNASGKQELLFTGSGMSLLDSAGKTQFRAERVANGVNFVDLASAITGAAVSVSALGDDASIGLTLRSKGPGVVSISSGNGLIAQFNAVASAVNSFVISSTATGSSPLISATGSDTNLDVRHRGKGTGGVDLQDGGSASKFRINTTGIGFFATTPVAQGALAAPTGTITRTTFATSSVTLPQLAERVYAMINDLRAYGLFS